MRVVIFGATGGLGAASVQAALAAGHEVTAFVRSPQKLTLRHERLQLHQGDVLDAAAVAAAIQGQEAVLSALGPAAGTPAGTIISSGTQHMIAGMKAAGVKRLVLASGLMVGQGAGMNLLERRLLALFRLLHRALYLDKVRAEAAVAASGLDWIVVRPPVLADLPARGGIQAGVDLDVRLTRKMPFADAGDYMVKALTSSDDLHKVIELST
jgi:putative NADH-flavin reductase